MAADRRRFALMIAALTVLVALALLFAPTAGATAMQCRERPIHVHYGVEQSFVQKDVKASLPGSFHTPDHKSCCTVSCGFCVVLMTIDRTEAPAARGSVLHFAWGDQTGSGLSPPPTLGPPRLSV